MTARKKLTNVEKIVHLLDIKEALVKKLEILKAGKKLDDFIYMSPQKF